MIKKYLKTTQFLSLATLFLSSCAFSVHQYHVSDTVPGTTLENSVEINAHREKFIVMGFSNNTDYVDEAFASLKKQCPQTITNINSRYSTALGLFSWTSTVKMTARCLKE